MVVSEISRWVASMASGSAGYRMGGRVRPCLQGARAAEMLRLITDEIDKWCELKGTSAPLSAIRPRLVNT
jgi:hypothetical protein